MKHNHYHKSVKHLEAIDVYRVLQLFGVTDPCLQHAVKKLLCAGQRGVKPVAKDVQEAIDSLTRWQEMLAEDAVFIQERIDNAPLAPASIQWPEAERHPMTPNVVSYPAVEVGVDTRFDQSGRQEVVEQNGNDGLAYQVPDFSSAPEGATHWHKAMQEWLQLRGQEYWFWMGNMWVFHAYKRYADGKNIFAIVQPSK